MSLPKLFLLALGLALVAVVTVLARPWFESAQPIRIGVLHSQTGTMAISERPLIDAVRLAVEEINRDGGLLGRRVEIVEADGRSDDRVFAAEAERLISQEKVSALFACWTSSCRKAIKPVVERHRHLMVYPLQYEGLEQSPNIFYMGSAPNQQIVPGTRWALDHLGKRVYLLGSDYIYPRVANSIIRDLVNAAGGTVQADRYLPLGSADFADIVAELRARRPDVVFNNLNGDSNRHFLLALRAEGLADLPVMSFSVEEATLKSMGPEAYHAEHYAVWSYFQSLPGEVNRRFVTDYRARFGGDRVASDPILSAYAGTLLWAQAVRDAGDDSPEQVNRAMLLQSIAGPSGPMSVDRASRHAWKPAYVGKARLDGQFDVIWSYGDTLRPRPFPDYRPLSEWQALIAGLEGRP